MEPDDRKKRPVSMSYLSLEDDQMALVRDLDAPLD